MAYITTAKADEILSGEGSTTGWTTDAADKAEFIQRASNRIEQIPFQLDGSPLSDGGFFSRPRYVDGFKSKPPADPTRYPIPNEIAIAVAKLALFYSRNPLSGYSRSRTTTTFSTIPALSDLPVEVVNALWPHVAEEFKYGVQPLDTIEELEESRENQRAGSIIYSGEQSLPRPAPGPTPTTGGVTAQEVVNAIDSHNRSNSAHADIRQDIRDTNTRIDNLPSTGGSGVDQTARDASAANARDITAIKADGWVTAARIKDDQIRNRHIDSNNFEAATLVGDGQLTDAKLTRATRERLIKVDGIEAGATADQTGTEIITRLDAELGTGWKTGGGSSSSGLTLNPLYENTNLGASFSSTIEIGPNKYYHFSAEYPIGTSRDGSSVTFKGSDLISGGSIFIQDRDSSNNVGGAGVQKITSDSKNLFRFVKFGRSVHSTTVRLFEVVVGTGSSAVTPTAAQIKTLYESNADTNAYTDAEKTKLAGIQAGATKGGSGGVTLQQVEDEIEDVTSPWAIKTNADGIPGSKTVDGLFKSESEEALPAANARISFDVGTTDDDNEVDETDAEDTSFNITAQQAVEPNAFIRVRWSAGGTQTKFRPTDVELQLQERDTGKVIGKHNLPLFGDSTVGTAEFPVGDAGAKRWAIRVVTKGRYQGDVHTTEATYHSSQSLADPFIEHVVHPIVSKEAEERQAEDKKLQEDINRVEEIKAIVNALPPPDVVVNKVPTWDAAGSTPQKQATADRYTIPAGGYVQVIVGNFGTTAIMDVDTWKIPGVVTVYSDHVGIWEVVSDGTQIYLQNTNEARNGPYTSDAGILSLGRRRLRILHWDTARTTEGINVEREVPEGGTTGQVLSKKSNDDYDTEWKDPSSGGLSTVKVDSSLDGDGSEGDPIGLSDTFKNKINGLPEIRVVSQAQYNVLTKKLNTIYLITG